MDNHILSETETQMMLTEVDGLASIIISKGTGGIDDEIIQNTKMSEVTDSTGVDISKLDKYSVFYLIPLPRRDVLNKSQTAVLGTRQTVIQGYTHALEYYSPAYPTKELYMDKVDKRRTLYWNPSVRTDENGKAVFKDPQKAFEALVRDYSDGINLIRDEYKLGPITPRNFYDYMTYGWQVNTGTEESKNQAAFVTQVLDVYENSYDFDKQNMF